MKKIIILIGIIASLSVSAQKDSTREKDSIAFANTISIIQQVRADMKATLYSKIIIDYYEMIEQLFQVYIKEKQLQWNSKK